MGQIYPNGYIRKEGPLRIPTDSMFPMCQSVTRSHHGTAVTHWTKMQQTLFKTVYSLLLSFRVYHQGSTVEGWVRSKTKLTCCAIH